MEKDIKETLKILPYKRVNLFVSDSLILNLAISFC